MLALLCILIYAYIRDEREICGMTAAAAKSLQSCLTLCNPIDGGPPRSAVPGILQVRTLEWVAFSVEGLGLVKTCGWENLGITEGTVVSLTSRLCEGK